MRIAAYLVTGCVLVAVCLMAAGLLLGLAFRRYERRGALLMMVGWLLLLLSCPWLPRLWGWD